ncbi:M28 family peptidase [Bacillus horti]|uniref:M28 family peptidase n=1 Tax=Caldalkalibacillus horti TaxID=77523 RepID=A0ABT9VYH2_9BACI|nr:M28 family peptidase [Bacillus horti]MDQ0165934.1 hypothetical protein [Bacillus horti]
MGQTQHEVENALLEDIDLTTAEAILNRFSSLVRESGSDDELIAANYLESLLHQWEISYRVHKSNIYLSVPKEARLKVLHPTEYEIKAKTPSASFSTNEDWVKGELIYLPAELNLDDKYDPLAHTTLDHVQGKIVLMDGYPVSGKVKELGNAGALGVIFISPGDYIHEGTCSAIWGSPDLDSMHFDPILPVLAVSHPDGEHLKKLSTNESVQLSLQTVLDEGWFDCPLIDIFIEGTEEPEKYVLLHGHLDSWHVGIGDNGTGIAALMEMARIFQKHRHLLKRSIRIAIWPGHSTGRYAGSTWFADQFGLDLMENCVAQVNCDSPGCRWATSYEHMTWMSEAELFCQEAIHTAVGQASQGTRPGRAGDYSFNNIGITSFFMLSSTIPDDHVHELNYYAVGGCGGNIEWHTEDDLMYVADYEVLHKDIRIYLTAIIRALNKPILPFNYVKTAEEFFQSLTTYQQQAGAHYSLADLIEEVAELRDSLTQFYKQIEPLRLESLSHPSVQKANQCMIELSRLLIRMNYSRQGVFYHDPALDIPALPDLAPVVELAELEEDSHRYYVTKNHVKRGANRLSLVLKQANQLVQSTLS